MEEVDGILVAAHELKEPLIALRQLALSLGNLSSNDEEIRSEMVSVSERALRQASDLAKIRNLKDGLFEMEPVSVRSVCDDVSREIAELFAVKTFRPKYQNRARLVTANRDLLKSILYNFLTSAVHYSAELAPAVTVKDEKSFVKILIRDYGPALPPEFWRSLKSSELAEPPFVAMRPGSSGLGLYIASKFSHYMNAKIGATRHVDGTSFFVALPVSKQLSLW